MIWNTDTCSKVDRLTAGPALLRCSIVSRGVHVPMGERILVVDDEETMCEVISSTLSSVGYECRTTTSAIEALAILDSGEEFALLISNLMMAKMDGFVLLERTRDRFPDMPFVMETGVYDSSVIAKAYQEGAYDYITKPFIQEWLVAAVRRALEYRRLKIENRAYQAELAKNAKAGLDGL